MHEMLFHIEVTRSHTSKQTNASTITSKQGRNLRIIKPTSKKGATNNFCRKVCKLG